MTRAEMRFPAGFGLSAAFLQRKVACSLAHAEDKDEGPPLALQPSPY
jgi:hypothetical protein